MESVFYLSGYAGPQEAGILRIAADFEAGRLEIMQSVRGILNPSWVLPHPGGQLLYAVEECDPDGKLTAFFVSGEKLQKACTLPTGGADPCHLSLYESAGLLCAANYTSGSLAVFRLDSSGLPLERSGLIVHSGHGKDPARQEGPHIHFSALHDGELYVTDLGLDRIDRYTAGPAGAENADRSTAGGLRPAGRSILFPEGSGPRHLVFHPDRPELLYVLCELSCMLHCFVREGDGAYRRFQSLCVIPGGPVPGSTAAAVRFSADGTALFTSCRSCDVVSAFAVHGDGTLELRGSCAAGGRTPRDLGVFGDYLAVACQDSRVLTVLHYDRLSGRLEPSGMSVKTECRPSCVAPL
ncbi:MAG: lactonase family protein [Lachnospiraceae bacterium]|nr:lactonase family protein [Lachnospiraceae bacterium]